MAITTALVSVGATATQLAAPAAVTSAAVGTSGVSSVSVQVPTGGATVFVGGADVTASGVKQGIAVAAATTFSMDLAYDDVLYGIVATGTQNVNVLNAMATKDG